jgi:uncharacterized protein
MTSVPVTALYGAINAIFFVGLSANVSRVRGKSDVWVGDQNAPLELKRAIRAQGNAAEYLPLALLLLLVLELSGASSLWLHVFGGALLVIRIAHAAGVLAELGAAHVTGAMGTWLLIAAEAVYVLVLRFR